MLIFPDASLALWSFKAFMHLSSAPSFSDLQKLCPLQKPI